jgi:uncharacterized caspase-like protein
MSVSQHIQRPAAVRVLPALLLGILQAALAFLVISLVPQALAQNRNLSVERAAASTQEEVRLALIIGNSEYERNDKLPRLKNPSNDATDIAAALKRNGFTNVKLLVDASRQQMMAAVTEFGDALTRAAPNGVGLFYYAGHGVQNAGKNYLIPVGANIPNPSQLEYEAVEAQRVLDFMQNTGNRVSIVILDACRDNPFPPTSTFRSAGAPAAGLAQMKAAKGSFIAFAAADGQRASDGKAGGRNGLFTQEFLESLEDPDSNIYSVFTRVSAGVSEETQGQQQPWMHSSLTNNFFFRPGQSSSPGGGSSIDQEAMLRKFESDRKRLEEEARQQRVKLDEEARQQKERLEQERRQQQARLEEERRIEAARAEQERQRARAQAQAELERQRAQAEAERARAEQLRRPPPIPFTP